MRKYVESKTTRIMMATVPHVTSGLGLRKFQDDGFLLTRVYIACLVVYQRRRSCGDQRNTSGHSEQNSFHLKIAIGAMKFPTAFV